MSTYNAWTYDQKLELSVLGVTAFVFENYHLLSRGNGAENFVCKSPFPFLPSPQNKQIKDIVKGLQ